MDLSQICSDLSIDQIIQGYIVTEESHICIYCGMHFDNNEIFKLNDRFYNVQKAIEYHIDFLHAERFINMINSDSKYLSLTDNQKELFILFYNGMSDNDVAKKLGVTASTVRHQKFMFREKAKAAKMFLSAWNLIENKNKQDNRNNFTLIPVHEGATMVDARYVITEEEERKILENVFISLEPLKLKIFSAKEKKKIVILRQIVKQFDSQMKYTEKEINEKLQSIYDDYATLRRYLIEYGYMDRTQNCSEYWVKSKTI